MTPKMKCQTSFLTPIGKIFIAATDQGLSDVSFGPLTFPRIEKVSPSSKMHRLLRQAESEILEFFNGERRKFSVQLDLQGTAFQQKVWAALCEIPWGQTLAYKEVARKIRNPKASRAVGSANGKNPIPIIIPCHRVIASDGGLGGYSSGLKIKKLLLKHEQVVIG